MAQCPYGILFLHGTEISHVEVTMMGKTIALALVIGAALCGCRSVKPTYLADGQKGYLVRCSGPMKRWSSCVTTAGKVCGQRGYSIRYQDELERELLVSCKGNTDTMAAVPQEP